MCVCVCVCVCVYVCVCLCDLEFKGEIMVRLRRYDSKLTLPSRDRTHFKFYNSVPCVTFPFINLHKSFRVFTPKRPEAIF